MRPDMHKVIVERPRHGSGEWYRKGSPRIRNAADLADGEDPRPHRMGMGRNPHNGRGRTKELSDNLNPLRGWLWKQAGRRWDDVFSELCRALPRNVHREHVLSHISRWVGGVTFSGEKTSAYWNHRTFDVKVNATGILVRCRHARNRYQWKLAPEC